MPHKVQKFCPFLHIMPVLYSARCVPILAGRNVRDAVRPRRLLKSRGALLPCLFLFNPKILEVCFMHCDFINGLPVRTEEPKFIPAEISENFLSELLSVEYGLRFLAKAASDFEEFGHNGGEGRRTGRIVDAEVLSGAAYVAHLLSLRLDSLIDEVKTDDD